MENTATFVGTLGKDPELRFTQGGNAQCTFSIAVNRRWKNNQGEQQEHTSWFNVVAWGQLGQNAAASLSKGTRVIVTGRLETRDYEKDGQKRTVTELVADALGPELRFATVQVERTERSTPRVDRAPDPVYGDEGEF